MWYKLHNTQTIPVRFAFRFGPPTFPFFYPFNGSLQSLEKAWFSYHPTFKN